MFGFPVFLIFLSKSGTLGPSGEGQIGGESETSMLFPRVVENDTSNFYSVHRNHTKTSGLLVTLSIKTKQGTSKTSSLRSVQHRTLNFLQRSRARQ